MPLMLMSSLKTLRLHSVRVEPKTFENVLLTEEEIVYENVKLNLDCNIMENCDNWVYILRNEKPYYREPYRPEI